MMRWIILSAGLLAACDTPGPDYRGVAAQRVTVGKSTFDVRIDGDTAQAIRLNAEWAPRPMAVMPRAVAAIEQVSQCRVSQIGGDQAVIKARLDCGDGPPVAPRTLEYDCDVRVIYRGRATIVCDPGI